MLEANRWRRLARGFGISAFVGPNGSGKSALAVFATLPSLDAGRPVLSTVRLLDYRNPRPCDDESCTSPNHATHQAAHPAYIPWTEWHQLADAEHCDVLADEITGVASSRDYSSLPVQLQNKLVQLRRADVVLRWTSPAWSRADSILREVSQAVTVCKGFMPVVDRSGDERMWRKNRLFVGATYDAKFLDDFEAGKREKVPKLGFGVKWGPGSDLFKAYDTLDSVEFVSQVSDSGRCMRCGGRRRPSPCSCSH